jgi:hypothetical protein
MNPKAWLLVAATLATGMAQATCYSIYKADGSLLKQSSTSPVDLSEQIGDTVPEKFGRGATMTVSDQDVYCSDVRERKAGPQSLADAVRADEAKSELKAAKETAAADTTKTAAQ